MSPGQISEPDSPKYGDGFMISICPVFSPNCEIVGHDTRFDAVSASSGSSKTKPNGSDLMHHESIWIY
ncbi:MAG: hypothetical protein IPF93_14700 [Saprospiraceae bacterium]|nr:hypothetical protein [Saprospiraceae bacterium]